MLRSIILRATKNQSIPPVLHHFNLHRGLHSRNKKALEFIAKGFSALQEVDRVIDHTEPNDPRLFPLLRTAKENFELALEADNGNTHARYWLARLHLKYQVPGACKVIGAALLVEAANMGDPDAQYELGCRLRVENENVQSDQQAFYYLEKAVDQLHPGALYLLGAVYLTGDCVKKDIASALWCFHRASEKEESPHPCRRSRLIGLGRAAFDPVREVVRVYNDIGVQSKGQITNGEEILRSLLGHAGAAIAYGSLLLKGAKVPEALTKFNLRGNRSETLRFEKPAADTLEVASGQFQKAAKAGCDLGFQWLKRLEDEEKAQVIE